MLFTKLITIQTSYFSDMYIHFFVSYHKFLLIQSLLSTHTKKLSFIIHKYILCDLRQRKSLVVSLEETIKAFVEQIHLLEIIRSYPVSSSTPLADVLYKSITLHTKFMKTDFIRDRINTNIASLDKLMKGRRIGIGFFSTDL